MSEPVDVAQLLSLIQNQDRAEILSARTDSQLKVKNLVEPMLAPVFAPFNEFKNELDVPAFRLNPEVHRHTQNAVRSGPIEIVSWDWVGVHRATFRGVPPTGRPVWIRAASVALDDALSRFQHFIDWRRVLIQLGVAPEATRPIVSSADRDRLARWVGRPG